MYRPWIVPVGGFLGAGKTSLILAAARILNSRGMRAAAVLNDQGHDLVDTAHSTALGLRSEEVTGACFCCRFSELVSAADRLRAGTPDVIFIEPVGSCIDLAATLLRPLQRDFFDQYQIAPLTVVIDPQQARNIELGRGDPNIKYLFEHQVTEADIVLLSKSDLPDKSSQHFPNIRRISSVTGVGIAAWLDEVLSGQVVSGGGNLSLDYSDYAVAEAALAWLNWSAEFKTPLPLTAAEIVGPFVEELRAAMISANATIAHVKVLAQADGSYLKAALTANEDEPIIEGDIASAPSSSHDLRVNIRAILGPEQLKMLFRQALGQLPGTWTAEHFQCFSPGEPIPERRIPLLLSV